MDHKPRKIVNDLRLINLETNLACYKEGFVLSALLKDREQMTKTMVIFKRGAISLCYIRCDPIPPQTSVQRLAHTRNVTTCCWRTQCLVESTKRGFTLNIDPSGERNRCLYQCLAAHLGMKDVQGLIDMLENYMLNHRVVPVMSCFRLTYNF